MQWDGLNRRRFVRVQYPFTVHIYLPDRPPISTYTEDVSEGGIKVTVRENIPLEVSVDLEIYLRSEPIICKGKVTWVGERISQYLEGVKLYDTGFEFFKVKEVDKKIIKKHVKELLKVKKEEQAKDGSESS